MSPCPDDPVARLARETYPRAEPLAIADRGEAAADAAASGSAGTCARSADANAEPAAGDAAPVIAARRFAEEYGLPFVRLAEQHGIGAEARRLVPREFARRHQLLPLACEPDRLRVAVSDPLAAEALDALGQRLRRRIDVAVAPADELQAAIERCYGAEPENMPAAAAKPAHEPAGPATARTSGHGGALAVGADTADAPIIRLVQSVIGEAVRRRASDIHWEPLETRFRIRYRIDGVLFEAEPPPKRLQLAIVSRIKIMANLSIAEKRLPQDGRIALSLDGRTLDLRVSTMPTTHGESVVMRLLDQANLRLGLAELGLAEDHRLAVERLLAQPDGMVLVTGPTGSGKTTTLYACLQHLNRADRKIITVEDPVEYQLAGVNQTPVRPEAGMTFASALRAILRQAPNVIMIGEIRDLETAEIAIHAALTGHLVFSTLHTNDAPGAIARLLDLGVKPFLIASALRAVLAQRLVRKTCESCAREYVPPSPVCAALELAPAARAGARFRCGAGCAACLGSGYHGRTAIFELLRVDEPFQQLIHARPHAAVLRARARAAGMRTLREDGARRAIAGLTTVEEVVSITVGDASLNPGPRAASDMTVPQSCRTAAPDGSPA